MSTEMMWYGYVLGMTLPAIAVVIGALLLLVPQRRAERSTHQSVPRAA